MNAKENNLRQLNLRSLTNSMRVPIAIFALILLIWGSSARAQDPREVYNANIGSVVWIKNRLSDNTVVTGSGVLVDRERKLVITNAHVVDSEKTVYVYFAVNDQKGNIISKRAHYSDNSEVLKSTGHYSIGTVVAVNSMKDLAIVRLTDIPKNAKAVEFAEKAPKQYAGAHIIGAPGGRQLWRWSHGIVSGVDRLQHTFKNGIEVDFKGLYLFGRSYYGNSGGPIFDDDGKLIGITQSINAANGGMYTFAVYHSEVTVMLLLNDADQLFEQKQFQNAAPLYRKITELDDKNGRAWFSLGYALHAVGQLDEAIKANERAAEFDAYKGVANYNIGCAYALKSQFDEAFKYLNKAVELGFNNEDTFKNDSDLNSLRTDTRFQKLMEKLRASK